MVNHPTCPRCGSRARAVDTRYGIRHDHCGLWSWGGAPLVDAGTHEARKAAHAVFDALWKGHHMTRKEAYKQLALKMRMKRDDCHIKLMDERTARRVPHAVMAIMRDLDDDGQVIED